MSNQIRFRQDLICTERVRLSETAPVILKDPITEKFFRLSSLEYRFLLLLDGSRTIPRAREEFRERGSYISVRATEKLVLTAAQMGLLLGTMYTSANVIGQQRERLGQMKRSQLASHFYFMYLPLVNPDRFLGRTLWLYRLLVNPLTKFITTLLAPVAVYLAFVGVSRMDLGSLYFFNAENLFCLWVTIAVTKLIHELGHAYVAKTYGLRVPSMGVALLVFFPCLYVDTTDAWLLGDRKQRIWISAAGIVAEAAIAIYATFLWTLTRPGLLNSIGFYMMGLSFVSSVLVNANPLIKRDGYFVLIDILDLPNLSQKSFEQLKYLLLNWVLGLDAFRSPAMSGAESRIYTLFGLCALQYRALLYLGVVSVVYGLFNKLLGLLLAFGALVIFVVRPILGGIAFLIGQQLMIRPRLLPFVLTTALVTGACLLIALPLPVNLTFPCTISPSRMQMLTSPLRGRISQVRVQERDHVQPGDILFELDTRELKLDLERKTTQAKILDMEYHQALVNEGELGRRQVTRAQMLKVQNEIQEVQELLESGKKGIVAPFEGFITQLDPRLQPGFVPGEGGVVGQLESDRAPIARALIPGTDRHLVHVGQDVAIWLPIGDGLRVDGRVESIRSHHEQDLGMSPFASFLGGEVATRTDERVGELTPTHAQYICTVEINSRGLGGYLGMTGRLAIRRSPRSLLQILIDGLVSSFNREVVS